MDYVQTVCVLDRENRLLYTGGDWDAFAAANGGAEAAGDAVRGRPVFEGVRGFEMRAFLNAVLFAVRDTGRPFVMDYRCDSPGVRRFMRMSVSSLAAERTLMVHDFLAEERFAGSTAPWTYVPVADAQKCSICCAVRFGGKWIDPFLSARPHPREVSAALCPDCREIAADLLRDRQGRMPDEGGRVVRFPGSAAETI